MPEGRFVGADKEVCERHPAGVAIDLGIDGQQEGRRIGVRVGEAEVAAQRSDVANADVGHLALHRRQGREALEYERKALDLPVGGGRTDDERAVLGPDPPQFLDPLDVDEVTVGGEPEFEQEQQLGAATDDRGVLSVPLQKLVGVVRRARTVKVERG